MTAPRRRWFQFSLTALFVAVLFVAIALAAILPALTPGKSANEREFAKWKAARDAAAAASSATTVRPFFSAAYP